MIFFGKIGLIYQNTTIIINQDQYYISATEYLEETEVRRGVGRRLAILELLSVFYHEITIWLKIF